MMRMTIYTQLMEISLIIFIAFISGCWGGMHEKQLLNDLFRHYNRLERPVANESDSLPVSFGMTLQQIIDVDEKNQILTSNAWLNLDEKNQMIETNLWLNLQWNDYSLRWNSSLYGGIKKVRLPPDMIWKPDILMYNSADEDIDSTFPTNVVVESNGDCLWVPPGLFLSTCKIDITWFPFDDQKCSMKFGSWTYDHFGIDLQLQKEEGDSSNFIPNGEWKLIAVPAKRNVLQYECCPEQYIDVTFTIHIRRRVLYYLWNLVLPCFFLSGLSLMVFIMPPDSGEKVTCGLPVKRNIHEYDCCPEKYIDITFTIHIRRRVLYYLVNLIIPCVLISSLALLTFTLPPEAGEKVSLGVTILLSLTVFLLLVAETMPPTSDAVPLIGMYFACIMLMCSLSVVFTVLVLNYHHRTPDTHNMPSWINKGINGWLAWILRMQRPGKEDEKRRRVVSNGRMRDVELRERSSRSLLANVLDIDDDLRGSHSGGIQSDRNAYYLSNHTHHYSPQHQPSAPYSNDSGSMSSSNQKLRYTSASSRPLHRMSNNSNHVPNVDSPQSPHQSCSLPCSCDNSLRMTLVFKDILNEIRFLTDKRREEDDFKEQCSDWKFAALVIDRLCLWVFSIFTFVSTCGILLSAPHTFD